MSQWARERSIRRRVRGNYRQLIKRLPASVSEEIRAQHQETGRLLLSRAYARVPVRTGELKRGLSFRITPKTLRLRFGLVGKPINRRLYYGRIVERGRKAGEAIANRSGRGVRAAGHKWRRTALRRGVTGFYRMRISPLPPKRFVYNMGREQLYRPYQKIWGRAIHRAATGASNS